MTVVSTLMKVLAFGAVAALLLVAVVTVVQRPVDGPTTRFAAEFTDASGLSAGDDVRMHGVAVGKVEGLELVDGLARVQFTVGAERALYDSTVIAIRYQNLTGQRYLDIQQPATPGTELEADSLIEEGRTIPSFDITSLFNGLRPVLAEMSPERVNMLTSNLIAVIEGDERGIGPALESIGELSDFAADRQEVVATLIDNLAFASQQLGGKSPETIVLLSQLANLFDELQEKVEGIIDFAMTAPSVMGPLDSLLANLGLTPVENPDLDRLVADAYPDTRRALESMTRVPVVLQSLVARSAPEAPGLDLGCSQGRADLPVQIQVLLDGQQVVVCR